MQTKKESLIESVSNTTFGLVFNFCVQLIFFPLIGLHVELHQNFEIIFIFTISSVVRQYINRRLFEKRAQRKARKQEQ